MGLVQFSAASRTHQFPVAALSPDAQLQSFRPLIDFMAIDPVPGPSQQFGQITISQTGECTENPRSKKITPAGTSSNSCAEPFFLTHSDDIPR
jgi:hypothetical protein